MADAGNTEKPFVSTIDRSNDRNKIFGENLNPLRKGGDPEVKKAIFEEVSKKNPQPTGGAIDALKEAKATGNTEYIEEVNAKVTESVINNPDAKYTNMDITMPPVPAPKVEDVGQQSSALNSQIKNPETPKNVFGRLITALKFK